MNTPKLVLATAVLVDNLDTWPELICRCIGSQRDMLSGAHNGAWLDYEIETRINTPSNNLGVTGSLQWLYEHTTASVIAFLHSDCEIFEPGWDLRVLREFDDPRVGVVGFGGALQLGEDEIYRTPYRLTQLRRIDYRSNTRDAEQHGERFTGACDVATLDGFALVVRRELLDHWLHGKPYNGSYASSSRHWEARKASVNAPIPGWPYLRYPFHNYDNALCVHAHRVGWRVRLVGIDCIHHGGATATTEAYQQWSVDKLGKPDHQVHTDSHAALYEDGRGVLPWRIK